MSALFHVSLYYVFQLKIRVMRFFMSILRVGQDMFIEGIKKMVSYHKRVQGVLDK